jgi:branched-subunit amino acid ABC-type transport system permease component
MLIVNEYFFIPLQKKGAENWQMMIASLGLYVVFQNLISIIWGDSTLSFRNWEIMVGYGFLGAYVTDVQIITIFSCIFLFLGIWLFLEKTILGRRIKAFSSNMELSLILGVSKVQVVIWSLILGTGLAASAGIMISADTDLSPTMGFNWMLYAVVVMIIGGSNRMLHLMSAALLLSLSQHLVAFYMDGKWMNAVAFIFLIIFLYLRPSGFSGKQVKKNSI